MNTLKKITAFAIAAILLVPIISFGQSNNAKQKLEAAKIGLITERLGLTPDQAQQFWPIYKQFSEQKRANQSEFKQLKKKYNAQTATEAETQQLIQKGQELKQSQLNLEKEYSDKLLNVINNKQLFSLRQAEDEFRKTILRKLQQRRQQQDRQQLQDRNGDRLRNKRKGN